jgi:hypothetical protein
MQLKKKKKKDKPYEVVALRRRAERTDGANAVVDAQGLLVASSWRAPRRLQDPVEYDTAPNSGYQDCSTKRM